MQWLSTGDRKIGHSTGDSHHAWPLGRRRRGSRQQCSLPDDRPPLALQTKPLCVLLLRSGSLVDLLGRSGDRCFSKLYHRTSTSQISCSIHPEKAKRAPPNQSQTSPSFNRLTKQYCSCLSHRKRRARCLCLLTGLPLSEYKIDPNYCTVLSRSPHPSSGRKKRTPSKRVGILCLLHSFPLILLLYRWI